VVGGGRPAGRASFAIARSGTALAGGQRRRRRAAEGPERGDVPTLTRTLSPRSTKPDKKEFLAVARATSAGFLIMGFIGFFVKLVHM